MEIGSYQTLDPRRSRKGEYCILFLPPVDCLAFYKKYLTNDLKGKGYTVIQGTSNFPHISTIGNKNGNSYTVIMQVLNQCA